MNDPAPLRAGIIDIGSNTIKILVGEKRTNEVHVLADRTVECRISTGMTSDPPRLATESMEAAVDAVQSLLDEARKVGTFPVEIVATSAVREAANKETFSAMMERTTSIPLQILSGEEEAQGIARGIGEERGIDSKSDYTVSDLGGGSLEWIHQRQGILQTAISLNVGAVRLLQRFVADPKQPLGRSEADAIRTTCREAFRKHLPTLPASPLRTHWGTGGAFTITRLLMASAEGRPFRDQPREIPVARIRSFADHLARLSLAERKDFPGLPETRADILPVALIILETLAAHTGVEVFRHSFHNLRMGRLALLLDSLEEKTQR